MNEYKKLLTEEIVNKKIDDPDFEKFIVNVNELLHKSSERIQSLRKNIIQKSIDTNKSISYRLKNKLCSRYEFISYLILDDFKREIRYLKNTLEMYCSQSLKRDNDETNDDEITNETKNIISIFTLKKDE